MSVFTVSAIGLILRASARGHKHLPSDCTVPRLFPPEWTLSRRKHRLFTSVGFLHCKQQLPRPNGYTWKEVQLHVKRGVYIPHISSSSFFFTVFRIPISRSKSYKPYSSSNSTVLREDLLTMARYSNEQYGTHAYNASRVLLAGVVLPSRYIS